MYTACNLIGKLVTEITTVEVPLAAPAHTDAVEPRPLRPEYNDILEYLDTMVMTGERRVAGQPSTYWEIVRPKASFCSEITLGPQEHDSPIIARHLGIAQSVFGSGEAEVHEALVTAFPDHTVMTIGNNGIDTKNTIDSASRLETAIDRHGLYRTVARRGVPIKIAGTSLGGQTTHDLAEHNLDCEYPIAIDGLVYHASGKLIPALAKHIIDHEFIPNLATTTTYSLWQMGTSASIQSVHDLLRGGFNIMSRYKPVLHLLSEAWHAGMTVATRHDVILHQASMLRDGTSDDRIRRVTASHLAHVILYQDDSLARGQQWDMLVDPANIEYLPGGHDKVFSPADTASALISAFKRISLQKQARDLAPAS